MVRLPVTGNRTKVLPVMAELAWFPKETSMVPPAASTLVTYLPEISPGAGMPADPLFAGKLPVCL